MDGEFGGKKLLARQHKATAQAVGPQPSQF